MNENWRYHIYGIVQGVGYRNSILRFVTSNLPTTVGYVRNMTDGSVEIVASGPPEELSALENFGHQGSRLSHVEKVVVEKNISLERTYCDFTIK
ncbi:MAG: acylphosphatase [Oligoflexia bacterium]|nr:acylphosphatase [Oligoflexia bacterium]